jgi:hypothetical protein
LIENKRNLILFLKVDGYLRELWKSAGMRMEEEYSLNRGMGTRMRNILDGGQRVIKYALVNSRPVDIPKYNICQKSTEQTFMILNKFLSYMMFGE